MADTAAPVRAYPDSHAHLSYVARRPGDLAAVAERYRGSGVMILDPGVDDDDFLGRKRLLGGFDFVALAAGIWPDAGPLSEPDTSLSRLEVAISDPDCVALGECGLDYHWMHGDERAQEHLFRAQAELAALRGLPLVVHSRDAHAPTLAVVRDYSGTIPVIIHCFGYDDEAARDYLAVGCYLSFAGNLTYKTSGALRAACSLVPDDRILLETDAPYMNPMPRRGKPSSPLDIDRTYLAAAALRGTEPEVLAEQVGATMATLFKKKTL
ncbi:MAG: TatD family hydrolase [Spirochaetia bacterium]|nr:TatD family hydrolase [Spirochaetia bacterium]